MRLVLICFCRKRWLFFVLYVKQFEIDCVWSCAQYWETYCDLFVFLLFEAFIGTFTGFYLLKISSFPLEMWTLNCNTLPLMCVCVCVCRKTDIRPTGRGKAYSSALTVWYVFLSGTCVTSKHKFIPKPYIHNRDGKNSLGKQNITTKIRKEEIETIKRADEKIVP